MADRILFICWGAPVRGREERALEVFNDAIGLVGRKQQEGAIESFDISLLAPNATIAGFMQVRGTAQQISALRSDDEFLRSTADAQIAVEGIQHIEGFCNEGIAAQMERYQQAISQVAQYT